MNNKIRIAMMFPWAGFFDVADEVIKADREFDRKNSLSLDSGEPIDYEVEEILAQGTRVDMDAIKEVDVIISRGLTADMIKKQVKDVPVVEIPVVGNDLVRSLFEAKQKYGNLKTGVVGTESMIYGVEGLAGIVGMELRPYFRYTFDDARNLVDRAISEGCKIIVGGVNSCAYAQERGLHALVMRTGKEAFWQALREAKRAAQISLVEQAKAKRVQAILDYSRGGIMEIDNDNRLAVCNLTGQEILNISHGAIGKPIREVLQRGRLLELIEKRQPRKDELVKYGEETLTLNLTEVNVKGQPTGLVMTFEDITRVQKMEGTIRKKMNEKGYIAKYHFDNIIGQSEVMKKTIENARIFASATSDILILGHSGTGKELFAQSIHNHSTRALGPFVAINCAAIQANLLESELFGYVEGAFTGAMKGGKQGLFEQAHMGTIFLDEIAEMPNDLQSKLLRVLEEREVMRLGDDKIIPIDIRVITATNKNLVDYVQRGLFREDLYYRLDVLTLRLPDLRERGKDVSLIAEHFIKQYAKTYAMADVTLTRDARKVLEEAEWKGNIRQLKNICTRAMVLNKTGRIDGDEIQRLLNTSHGCHKHSHENCAREDGIPDFKTLEEQFEAERIMNALRQCNYNRSEAMKILGMSRATLWRKINKYWPKGW